LTQANISKACEDIGRILYFIAGIYILAAVLLLFGFFSAAAAFPYILLVLAAIYIVIAFRSKRHKEVVGAIRVVQIGTLLLTIFLVNILTGYKAWLLYSLPILLSCRYYDRSFTVVMGVLAGLLVILTAFANAYLFPYIGFIDLNTVSFSEPGTLEYYNWLYNAVLKHGYETERIVFNSLRLIALPNCMIIVLMVIGCCSYIRDAENMLLASYQAAEMEQEQKLLLYRAMHDELTGLQNRRSFTERMAQLKESSGFSGVIFSDMNGLKYTNDTFGHGAGDQLITRYTALLTSQFRVNELYRVSGDEFICVMENVPGEVFEGRVETLGKMLEKDAPPIACFGYAFGSNADVEKLLKNAETAMYTEKDKVHVKYPEMKR